MTRLEAFTRRSIPVLLWVAAAMLFYFANRAAYQAWFSSDDLDKTGWPTFIGARQFYGEFVSPRFSPGLVRPTGYLYYRLMWPAFQLWYQPYVFVLQAFHIV